eukprot:14820-Heterococcus_DN1.PRE.5
MILHYSRFCCSTSSFSSCRALASLWLLYNKLYCCAPSTTTTTASTTATAAVALLRSHSAAAAAVVGLVHYRLNRVNFCSTSSSSSCTCCTTD